MPCLAHCSMRAMHLRFAYARDPVKRALHTSVNHPKKIKPIYESYS